MKLGIVVVYLVDAGNERLLETHLRFIRENTRADYEIHGVATRLTAEARRMLEAEPAVRLHSLPAGDERGHHEHSRHLEALVAKALDSGCTHLATFHVDSFPIAEGWEGTVAAKLSAQSPVCAVLEPGDGDTPARPSSVLLFCEAAWWRQARPAFYPDPATLEREDFRAFLARHGQTVRHSGIGIGWALHQRGESWTPLTRSNRWNPHPVLAGVYGGVVFHLGAAARRASFASDPDRRVPHLGARAWYGAMRRLKAMVPPAAKSTLRTALTPGVLTLLDPATGNRAQFERLRAWLDRDADGLIRVLVAGR